NVSIALHLAKVIGLRDVETGKDRCGPVVLYTTSRDLARIFDPRHDRAQCMEVIEWAAVNGLEPDLSQGIVRVWPTGKDYPCAVENDNTPEGVRAAALEAVARATGWPGMVGE
ncbi:MAG: hypothetical protein ABFE08_07050, partial [Armatimonadia bacterium]